MHKFHHQERHGATHHAKVRNCNDVLMTNGRGRQRFLTKARDQHRIVADQVRQDDLDCMLGLQKDVPRLENDAHAAAPKLALDLVRT